jgi:hypothetical protein
MLGPAAIALDVYSQGFGFHASGREAVTEPRGDSTPDLYRVTR